MIRSQIYLTEEQKRALATASKARGVPVAELVREAVDDWLEVHHNEALLAAIREVAGMWADRAETGEEYVDRIRDESEERFREHLRR